MILRMHLDAGAHQQVLIRDPEMMWSYDTLCRFLSGEYDTVSCNIAMRQFREIRQLPKEDISQYCRRLASALDRARPGAMTDPNSQIDLTSQFLMGVDRELHALVPDAINIQNFNELKDRFISVELYRSLNVSHDPMGETFMLPEAITGEKRQPGPNPRPKNVRHMLPGIQGQGRQGRVVSLSQNASPDVKEVKHDIAVVKRDVQNTISQIADACGDRYVELQKTAAGGGVRCFRCNQVRTYCPRLLVSAYCAQAPTSTIFWRGNRFQRAVTSIYTTREKQF
ncbi:MAG: hypothetical protein AAF587_44905, partial [Bacteroidota bacterium]